MDLKTSYLLMGEIYYDSSSKNSYVPEELINYFNKLKKKNDKTKYDYSNLDDFIETIINIFYRYKYYSNEKFKLELENKSYINFKLNNFYDFPNSVQFSVKNIKKKNDNCLIFTWYPFNKTIYLNSLFYTSRQDDKIVANTDCDVKDIPEKSGEFFLNLIEDLGKKLSVKKIILQDASSIILENKQRVSLALYYLKKHGNTYYGKFGYKPISASNSSEEIVKDIGLDIDLKSNTRNLNFIKKELKKIKNKNLRETLIIFKELDIFLPKYYMKKI